MKKTLLFLAFVALCCSFTIIKYHKTAQTDATFEELLAQFPKGTLPFTLSKDSLLDESFLLEKHCMESKFSPFFPSLEIVSQNGCGCCQSPSPTSVAPKEFETGVAFRAFETGDRHILVYKTGVDYANYYAAAFTKKGEYLGEWHFARAFFNSITDTKLDENLNLTCHYYAIIREKDRDGYETDNIVKLEHKETKTVSLAQNGTSKPVIRN